MRIRQNQHKVVCAKYSSFCIRLLWNIFALWPWSNIHTSNIMNAKYIVKNISYIHIKPLISSENPWHTQPLHIWNDPLKTTTDSRNTSGSLVKKNTGNLQGLECNYLSSAQWWTPLCWFPAAFGWSRTPCEEASWSLRGRHWTCQTQTARNQLSTWFVNNTNQEQVFTVVLTQTHAIHLTLHCFLPKIKYHSLNWLFCLVFFCLHWFYCVLCKVDLSSSLIKTSFVR